MVVAESQSSIALTDNARTILESRYLNPGETAEERFDAVARHIATAEKTSELQEHWYRVFRELLFSLEFLPNSPTIANAGRGHRGSLSACFVRSPQDTMEDILRCQSDWGMIEKWGGGVGAGFNHIRPRGSKISTTHGIALGPIAVMRMLSANAKEITQGAFRLGAHMGQLDITHPDIREFVHCKDQDKGLENFNISVQVTDEFMQAVKEDKEWFFVDPHTQERTSAGPAQALWAEICESAWKTGDPGVVFMDRIWETQPLPHIQKVIATNPCLVGTTRMLTDRGLVRIQDIERSGFDSPDGWVSGRAWKTGHKAVVNIVLSNGMSITTTPDHRFLVGESWVEAAALEGELQPLLGKGDWEAGDDPLADGDDYIRMGFLVGDGHRHEGGGVYANIGTKDGDMAPYFAEGTPHSTGRQVYFGKSSRLTNTARSFGLDLSPLPERRLPESVFTLTPQALKLFLKGIYSANGSVLDPIYRRVTMKSTNLKLLRDVQLLLLALGIRPYITANRPSTVEWPNGTYTSRQSYDLNIAGNDCIKFREEIGIVQQYKQERLEQIQEAKSTRRIAPRVIAIEPVGDADVYDFSVPGADCGWANGFLVHNCGEQPLMDFESCNLGSIDLGKFVLADGPHAFDWDRLSVTIATAVRFLDNTIDINEFPLPQLRDMNLRTRRIGLGIMGWADALTVRGIPYDSAEALNLAERTSQFLSKTAWQASRDLAVEKGACPEYEGSALESMLKWGHGAVRNSCVTSIAPTGSISLIAGCSSGIEPYFAAAWRRKALWKDQNGTSTEIIEVPSGIQKLLAQQEAPDSVIQRLILHPEQKNDILRQVGIIPSVVRTAGEISPEYHVRMLAAWQKHITSSVSKTVNLPNEAKVEAVYDAFMLAWETGCKAVTVYRDGSKSIQVLDTGVKVATSEKANQLNGAGGSAKFLRPRSLTGTTERISTSRGTLYVTINFDGTGNIIEVFSTLGKGGQDDSAYLEAISRMISVSLQHGLGVDVVLDQLSGIKADPVYSDGALIRSVPDAIAVAIKRHVKEGKLATNIAVNGHENVAVLPSRVVGTSTGLICPDCNARMVLEENCAKCYQCGYARCA